MSKEAEAFDVEELQDEIAQAEWLQGKRAATKLSKLAKSAADYIEALTDTLESLLDEQNGPPLIRREKQWREAVNKANSLLGRKAIQ